MLDEIVIAYAFERGEARDLGIGHSHLAQATGSKPCNVGIRKRSALRIAYEPAAYADNSFADAVHSSLTPSLKSFLQQFPFCAHELMLGGSIGQSSARGPRQRLTFSKTT
jgi:hypothetical protein